MNKKNKTACLFTHIPPPKYSTALLSAFRVELVRLGLVFLIFFKKNQKIKKTVLTSNKSAALLSALRVELVRLG
jgi:cytochrome c-type biogenesis protein CcmH/NrfF